MDVAEQIKKRVRRAADTVVTEMRMSHGIENVSISLKETEKSITITIRESSLVESSEGADDDDTTTE